MKRAFNRINYIIFVLAFSFQMAFSAVPTAQHHADSITAPAGGTAYTDIMAITNAPARKNRFFGHVEQQHFGLSSGPYAQYVANPEDKVVRSEFILEDDALGAGIVSPRRTNVEKEALNNYAFETLMHNRTLGKNFKDFLMLLKATPYAVTLPDGLFAANTVKMHAYITCFNDNNEAINKLIAIYTRLDVFDHVTYGDLLQNITALQNNIAAAVASMAAPANITAALTAVGAAGTLEQKKAAVLALALTPAQKQTVVAAVEGIRGPIGAAVGDRPQIDNLMAVQRLEVYKTFVSTPQSLALSQAIFTYAMGRPGKTSVVTGKDININCSIVATPLPANTIAGVARIVSKTPWYNAGAHAMITQAQRPDSGRILVGFSRYAADDPAAPPQYHEGDLDYDTMYPIP